jgi:N-acetylmuramoyl-L-alanine amidase
MLTQQSLSVEFTPVAHYWQGRGGYLPIAIVEGMMVGTLDEARRYFSGVTDDGNEYMVSAHYGIGRDGRVYQFVREDDSAWSNGILESPDTSIDWIREVHETGVNCNLVTLSVEYEGNPEEGLTEAQYAAALELHRHLVRRWKIEVDPAHIVGKDALDNRFHAGNPGENFPFMRLLTDLLADAENMTAEPVTPPPVTNFADEIFGVPGATEIEVVTPAEIAGETVELKMEEESDAIVPAPAPVESSDKIDPHLRPAITAELLAETAPAEPRQDDGVTSGFLGFIEAEEAAQIDAPPVGDMFDHDLDAAFDRMQPQVVEELEIRTETAHSELELDRVLEAYDHATPVYNPVVPGSLEAATGLPYNPASTSLQAALGLAEGVTLAPKLAEVYEEAEITPPSANEVESAPSRPLVQIPTSGLASKIGVANTPNIRMGAALGLPTDIIYIPGTAKTVEPEIELDYSTGVPGAKIELDYAAAATPEPELDYAAAATPEPESESGLDYSATTGEPAEVEIEHDGKTAHFAPLEENATIFEPAVTPEPQEFSAPSAPMVETAPEAASAQNATSDLTPTSSRPEPSASAARIVDDESPVTSAPSAYPFDLTPEPDPAAAPDTLMYPFELPDNSPPSRTEYDFNFTRRQNQTEQSSSSFVYPFDLPPAPEPLTPPEPSVETENLPEPEAMDTYEHRAVEVPDTIAPVTDEATFRLLQDLRIPPARTEVKPEPEPTPEPEPEQDEFSRMLAAGILPPDLALEEPEFDLFAPLPPKPVTYAEPTPAENTPEREAVAVAPQPGEPDAVFEVAEVPDEKDEPPATSYADTPQTQTELEVAALAPTLKGNETIEEIFYVEEVPADTGPARNMRELSGHFEVATPAEPEPTGNPTTELSSSAVALPTEPKPAKPASGPLLDFLFDDMDDFPSDIQAESTPERLAEPPALPKVELPSSAADFRFDLPDLPPLAVKDENKLPELPSFEPPAVPFDPRGDKVTAKLPELTSLSDFPVEFATPAPQPKTAEPETETSTEHSGVTTPKQGGFDDFEERPLDLKGYTAPLSFEEFDFEPPEELLGYEQRTTSSEQVTSSQPSAVNRQPDETSAQRAASDEQKGADDLVVVQVDEKPVAFDLPNAPEPVATHQASSINSRESVVNQAEKSNPDLSVPEIIEVGGFPLHLETIGGGEIAVELANLRSTPAFEPGTIIRESEQGERFTFDGWTEGPELFGSTRWLHFKEDGGGWLHSSLVKLDKDS